MFEYYSNYKKSQFKYDINPCDENERDMNFALITMILFLIMLCYSVSIIFTCTKETSIRSALVLLLIMKPELSFPIIIFSLLGGCQLISK